MITGKGRCNITNAADITEILRNIHGNGAFLNSSLRAFDNQDVIHFFEEQGVPTKQSAVGVYFQSVIKRRMLWMPWYTGFMNLE